MNKGETKIGRIGLACLFIEKCFWNGRHEGKHACTDETDDDSISTFIILYRLLVKNGLIRKCIFIKTQPKVLFFFFSFFFSNKFEEKFFPQMVI